MKSIFKRLLLLDTKICVVLLAFLGGCFQKRILRNETLKNECDAILQIYLPKFGLSSLNMYCGAEEGSTAQATGNAYLLGLWKNHWIEIESEEEFSEFPHDVREFILCHELAHIKLGHIRFYFWQKPTIDLSVSHKEEYEADKLAVQVIGSSRGALKLFLGRALIDIIYIFLVWLVLAMIYCLFRRSSKAYKRVWILLGLSLFSYFCIEIVIPLLIGTHPPVLFRAFHALYHALH